MGKFIKAFFFTSVFFFMNPYLIFSQDEVPKPIIIISEILKEFSRSGDNIWPGFDLTKQTIVIYEPDNWALLLNASAQPEDFVDIPTGWPDLGTDSYVHFGKYKDLSGQLLFNFEIDGMKTAAVGLIPSNFSNDWELAEHIVHEAFHQFQATEFNYFPYFREEYYPILNPENAAMASLELKYGQGAISSIIQNDEGKVKDFAAKFCAIREVRWSRMDPFIRNFETGLENKEATAEYVGKSFVRVFFADEQKYWDWVLEGFDARITNNTIAPTDVARNKVYQIGLAQALMLDFFNVDWKPATSKAAETDALYHMLADSINFDQAPTQDSADNLLESTEYTAALAGSQQLTAQYKSEFTKQYEQFKNQDGIQIKFVIPSNGVSRSRSSSNSRYYLRSGKDIFCKNYKIYSLKGASFLIQILKTGVFETNDYKAKQKAISSYHSDIEYVSLNSEKISLKDNGLFGFKTLEINHEGLSCKIDRKGVLIIQDGKVHIVIYP